jgi:hypothetical protein
MYAGKGLYTQAPDNKPRFVAVASTAEEADRINRANAKAFGTLAGIGAVIGLVALYRS